MIQEGNEKVTIKALQTDLFGMRLNTDENIAYSFCWESNNVRDSNSTVTLAVIGHCNGIWRNVPTVVALLTIHVAISPVLQPNLPVPPLNNQKRIILPLIDRY